MKLRTKVLGLFLLLGVLPLVGLGVVEYVRSLRAVEALLVAQNARLAERVATVINARNRRMESDLLLLAENAESQRWLRSGNDAVATAALRKFLDDAWLQLKSRYRGVQLIDVSGHTLGISAENGGDAPVFASGVDEVVRPIRDESSGSALGTLRVRPRGEKFLADDELTAGFGERGLGLVVDRSTDSVIYHSRPQAASRSAHDVFGSDVGVEQLAAPSGQLRFVDGDTAYVAAYQSVEGLPWTVVMAAAVPEFSVPFASVGRSTLVTFTVVALLAALAFTTLVGRTTRSLEELTAAASVVGQGDFAPVLPSPGGDEVGRLSGAFGTMVSRVRDMMEEVRANRQMAVLGEFAAQLSHEVRNPLTSIKLNQQRIQRFLGEQDTPPDIRQSMTIALREIDRLDGVVRGVLQLARQPASDREVRSMNALVREAVEVIAEQAAAQHVQVIVAMETDRDRIRADATRLKGALLNLFINALEAMPDGGTLRLAASAGEGTWKLTVTDTGAGIPEERRSTVFTPFSTTKPVGTGLGLPIARRAIEEHGGTLSLEPQTSERGTTFVVALPVMEA